MVKKKDGFAPYEIIKTSMTPEFTESFVHLYAHDDGYWVTVETDSYEGSAMMTLACAEKLHAALGGMIARAKAYRETLPDAERFRFEQHFPELEDTRST